MRHFAIPITAALFGFPLAADPAQVVDVSLKKTGMDWRVSVTIAHPDTGWDHYADGWEVLDEAGNRLGFRELLHPHVNEQPFTRSLGAIYIPDGTTKVYIRTRCNVDGWDDALFEVTLDR